MLYYNTSNIRATKGRGVYLQDATGRWYMDCSAGTFNLSLGYSHPAVLAAMKRQMDTLVHVTSSLASDPIIELATKLSDLAPGNLNHVNPKVCSGSTANEGMVRMAQHYTGRGRVLTTYKAHVGQTIAMTSLSGNSFRRAAVTHWPDIGMHVPDPGSRRYSGMTDREAIDAWMNDFMDVLEYAGNNDFAALLIEPIQGNGGNFVPPRDFFINVQSLCADKGICLLFDEIQTGIGRTGYMFACEYFNVVPDALTVAKGLGGSGAQVAAIIATDNLKGLPHDALSFTYGSNLVAAAAANATLDIIRSPGFLQNVRDTGSQIQHRMNTSEARDKLSYQVHGLGLMIGLQFANTESMSGTQIVNALAARAPDFGLMMRTSRYGRGDVLKIRPSLNITSNEAHEMCDRIERLITDLVAL